MQKNEMQIISNKLDTLIQLVAISVVGSEKQQKQQIRLLMLAGLTPLRIAEILGTTSNSVNGAIAKMRQAKQLPHGRYGNAEDRKHSSLG